MKLKIIILSILAAFVGGLRTQFSTANVEGSAGTHTVLNMLADGAHTDTHLLVKTGSDAFHAAPCGANDYPIGITTDDPEAAEDLFQVAPSPSAGRRAKCAWPRRSPRASHSTQPPAASPGKPTGAACTTAWPLRGRCRSGGIE